MSNYTKLTDFAVKDTLPTGNAAKIVKGQGPGLGYTLPFTMST